jgi:hypothetical protein
MQDGPTEEPQLVRDRFAYIDEFNAFVLARVDDALREWNDHERQGVPRERRAGSRRERSATSRSGAKRQVARDRLG